MKKEYDHTQAGAALLDNIPTGTEVRLKYMSSHSDTIQEVKGSVWIGD